MNLTKRTVAGLLLVCWLGCAEPADDRNSPAVTQDRTDRSPAGQRSDERLPAESTPSQTVPVELEILDWDATMERVAQQEGKVVVLDLWATSCVPCLREFPQLVALQRRHPEDVQAISVSVDYDGIADRPPESYRERVMKVLTANNATFTNILINEDPDALYERLDLASIPAVFVFNREGELVKRFDNEDPQQGEFNYQDDVVPLVNRLIEGQ